MKKYTKYLIEDFVLDADFQDWVRHPTLEKNQKWEEYKIQNPDQADDIEKARLVLASTFSRFNTPMSEAELETAIATMLQKIRGEAIESYEEVDEETVQRFFPILRWLSAAILICIVGWSIVHFSDRIFSPALMDTAMDHNLWQENDTDSVKSIVLKDGSKVVLSPASELRIAENFGNDRREVYLIGEASFEVTRDVERPFLVYSENLITRVLGTSFVITAMKNGRTETVEVKEGKVSVFKKEDYQEGVTARQSQGLLVTSNQKVTLEIRDKRLVKTLVDTPAPVPAKSKMLKSGYVNTPVSKVLKDLQEAYQVEIVFDEDLLSNCPLTAVLTDQTLNQKLEMICEAIAAEYEYLDGRVVIYARSCNDEVLNP